MSVAPRVVVIWRPTEYDELVAEHGTRGQVEFFLGRRKVALAEIDQRHQAQATALDAVARAIPSDWRRATVARGDLDRWTFEADDIIVAVGQDGLVANVAKYLDGQMVVGVTTDVEGRPGVLVRVHPEAVRLLFATMVAGGDVSTQRRAMVQISTDDGLSLRALNEIYVGHRGHQSARYSLAASGAVERQSSSGILVGTGTGATGWCASVWNERTLAWALPGPVDRSLAWFVREAWPSASTGVSQTAGLLVEGEALTLVVEGEGLVAFGDGIETDHLDLRYGQECTITVAAGNLLLATGVSRPAR